MPTSTERNKLADAFNDRIRSGLGDAAWRIFYKAFTLMRNFEIPSENLTPAQDAWFQVYAHVEPGEASPGNQLNEANPLNLFVLGRDESNVASEAGRVNVGATLTPFGPVGDPAYEHAGLWELGRRQRGLYDPASGAENAPATEAANSHYPIHQIVESPYGGNARLTYLENFGGYFGTPRVLGTCEFFETINIYEVVFTNLQTGERRVYDNRLPGGDCGGTPENIQSYLRLATAYRLYRYSGQSFDLPYENWIEGPYTGGATLRKHPGDQLDFILAHYVAMFRGSDGQRITDSYRITEIAADFQKFFERQYLLAAALGTDDGNGLRSASPSYVHGGEQLLAGHIFLTTNGEDAVQTVSGFVMAGFYIRNNSEDDVLEIEFLKGGDELFHTESVPAKSDKIVWWEHEPDAVRLRLKADWFGPELVVEFAELEKRTPAIQDAYWLFRRATTTGVAGTPDTTGPNYGSAADVIANYFRYAAVINSESLPIVSESDIFNNPIHEAVRDVYNKHLRLIKRRSIASYSVEGGVSVIRFNRYEQVSGTYVDLWEGLRPPEEAIGSGQLLSGVLYKIQGSTGEVTYNGQAYAIDETFTAEVGVKNYTATGNAKPYQVDGIISAAPATGKTNEWVMFMSWNLAESVATGLGEETGDILGMLQNRCLAASSDIADSVNAHMSGGERVRPFDFARAPSWFTYIDGINHVEQPGEGVEDRFYKSCPVYPQPYGVRSITLEEDDGAYTRIKVVFDRRFQNNNTETDNYRTDENALQEYLSGICPNRIGDQAAIPDGGNYTYGACSPRFYFVKLIEKVFADEAITGSESAVTETRDTRCFAEDMNWMWFALSAMCEGYIDPFSTAEVATRRTNYNIETLCYRAFGNRWTPLMPQLARIRGVEPGDETLENTGEFVANEVNEKSWGPFANMRLYYEQFNHLADAINFLTRLPLDLPITLQHRQTVEVGRMAASGANSGLQGEEVQGSVCGEGGTLRTGTGSIYATIGSASTTGLVRQQGEWIGSRFLQGSGFRVNGEASLWRPCDEFGPMHTGFQMAFAGGFPYIADVGGFIVGEQEMSEYRFTSAPSAAVPETVKELLTLSGEMYIGVVYGRQWWEVSDNGSHPGPGWSFEDVKFEQHSESSTAWATKPASLAMLGDGAFQIDPLPLHSSAVFYHENNGAVFVGGPTSSAVPVTQAFFEFSVDLV